MGLKTFSGQKTQDHMKKKSVLITKQGLFKVKIIGLQFNIKSLMFISFCQI